MNATVTKRGFHRGELEVQRRAGVDGLAARLQGMLAAPRLDGGAATFLARREFAVLTGRDAAGRLWTSPLLGSAGFLEAHGSVLDVHGMPWDGDPLAGLPVGQDVGLIAIEFAIRRRFRVNGLLSAVSGKGLRIEADQAFGNCPAYIQPRVVERTEMGAGRREGALGAGAVDVRGLVGRADTFFLGTAHPERGVDTSHKGGRPGFVRVETGVDGGVDELWWPDYAGNNMFNSLGNLVENPEASLLFVDFATGRTLQLSGTATLEWIEEGSAGDDGDTGRRVRFRVEEAARVSALPLRSAAAIQSPDNPPLRDNLGPVGDRPAGNGEVEVT